MELTTFPSLSLGELGIAVAVALPRQLPEFVQGRADANIPIRPVDVSIGFTRIQLRSR